MKKINAQLIVTCDSCKSTIKIDYVSKSYLPQKLRAEGWAVGKQCLCDKCRFTPQEWHLH